MQIETGDEARRGERGGGLTPRQQAGEVVGAIRDALRLEVHKDDLAMHRAVGRLQVAQEPGRPLRQITVELWAGRVGRAAAAVARGSTDLEGRFELPFLPASVAGWGPLHLQLRVYEIYDVYGGGEHPIQVPDCLMRQRYLGATRGRTYHFGTIAVPHWTYHHGPIPCLAYPRQVTSGTGFVPAHRRVASRAQAPLYLTHLKHALLLSINPNWLTAVDVQNDYPSNRTRRSSAHIQAAPDPTPI